MHLFPEGRGQTMSKYLIFFLSIGAILIFTGCAQRRISNTNGSLTLIVKKQNLPAGINILTIDLIGPGSAPITVTQNNLTDKNTNLVIPSLRSGKWQGKVTIKNQNGNILFEGEKELNIVVNTTLKTYLHLYPDSNKSGSIYFYITYGNDTADDSSQIMKNLGDTSEFWTDYSKNPILSREGHPTNPFGIRGSKVIYDNGIFKMWYFAVYSHAVANIWYAESHDGLNWKTIGSSPVLIKGNAGSWDDYTVVVSSVIKENNLYKMYYVGYHNDNVNLHINDTWHIGIAVSSDGIHWTKNPNPIIYGTGFENMNISDIVKKDNKYYAYFGYSLTQATYNNTRIGVAISSNGIIWELQKIMEPTFKWEGTSVTSPSVILEDGIFKMIYVNSENNSFGYATSNDGIHFIKRGKPIFNSSNTIYNNNSLMSPNFRKINNIYWLFYGISSVSGEMEICVARNFRKNFE